MSESFVAMRNYSDNSSCQRSGAVLLSKMLEEALNKGLNKLSNKEIETGTITTIEFGCATGSSSLDILNKILVYATINGCRTKAIMNDLPLNNWNELKTTLQDKLPMIDVKLSRQSMYNGIVSTPGNADIAYSCFAQHWLSKGVPCHLPVETGAIWGNQLAGFPQYKDIHDTWAKASYDDWDRFLTLRAQEVHEGGIMVLLIQSSLDGTMPDAIAETCQAAKKKCLEEGIITADEAKLMCMPEYVKTRDEILTPLLMMDSPHASKWTVLDFRRTQPDACTKHITDSNTSDEEKMNAFVQLARGFMDASLEQAFEESARKKKLNFFWEMVLRIADNDHRKVTCNVMTELFALKRGESHDSLEEKKEMYF
eukprot:695316-Ditylum_brightwellii.AAC.1